MAELPRQSHRDWRQDPRVGDLIVLRGRSRRSRPREIIGLLPGHVETAGVSGETRRSSISRSRLRLYDLRSAAPDG